MVSALLLFGYLTGGNRLCVFQHKHMPAYCRTARHGVLAAAYDKIILCNTKNQLKTIQKIEHNLAYMDYAMIFCL